MFFLGRKNQRTFIGFHRFLATILFLLCPRAEGAQTPLLHPSANYFATPDGRPVYLAGIHSWTDNVSYTETGRFDFAAYLGFLRALHANLTRYWAPDSFAHATNSSFGASTLNVFRRTGPGFAADGGPKFDLTRFNQNYFRHLRADVEAAGAKGVYVDVMLFFDYNPPGARYGTWRFNPWNGANNVNGTTRNDLRIEQLSDPHLLSLQEAYVAKTLDTLRDLPNVLFEVANEAANDPRTLAWQNRIVDFIHAYEARHGFLRHPAGITAPYTTDNPQQVNAALMATDADWISPTGGSIYKTDPPRAAGEKVQIVDTDHVFGLGGDANWVWQQFTRGYNVLVMDDLSGTGLPGALVTGLSAGSVAAEVSERRGVSETRRVSQLTGMTGMQPADSLSSTRFTLASASESACIVYAPKGGTITVNLSRMAGKTLNLRWMNIADGRISSAATIRGGARARRFTAPFAGAAVLILTRRQH